MRALLLAASSLSALFGLFALSACQESDAALDAGVAADAEVTDGGAEDASHTDDGSASAYGHVPPPAGAVPEVLSGARWIRHLRDDLLPFWTMPSAAGVPEGNFPTYRGMDGSIQGSHERRPRMIARQIYAYSMSYLLTGDARLLELAHAGMFWLKTKARDPRGGCHERLDEQGNAIEGPKFAQDTAYCALGFAAYYFVTRDPEAEVELLALRDLLFDPATYWDAQNRRIRDGRSADLSSEVDQESDGGWELVAQLDAVNAFLLLSQPVLSSETRRAQALADLETLSQTMIDLFWADGIFWGVSTKKGQYGTRHVDFGHTLKSYWMLLQVDKRLAAHPFRSFVLENVHHWITRAYDATNGRWAKRPTSASTVEYGSDWWIYAEADQLAATLDFLDARYADERALTGAHWLEDYVDTRPAREIISGIRRDGSPVYGWPDTDTAKCNEWKNGFHSVEHALVMYLAGQYLADAPAVLHFAVPAAAAQSFLARPYVFDGRELDRAEGSMLTVGGQALREVSVRFGELY
ncbi:MAG: AGE family epimerase/isomerase [Deltaproteobacteria bacterium]|nr:AGE family epimerase/isomerase [Deltaproteobacteria bacterium]